MHWKRVYYVRDYLKSSLWIVPLVAIPLELGAIRVLLRVDSWLGWSFLNIGAKGADEMLNAIVTATLSFVVFTFGSLLVALQVASGQMTPRIIATILVRNNVVRYTAGLFIFTLLFAISAANRIEDKVPQLVVFVAACFGVFCFAAFLFLIDYAARLLRPISILSRVGESGLATIGKVYPDPTMGRSVSDNRRDQLGTPGRVIRHQGESEIIVAANLDELVIAAEKSNGMIEFVPQIGDFIAVDEPLFKLHGGATSLDDDRLRAMIAFGPERTMEQDPTFSYRIIVDVALKALSPAINDPTTAVIAIDQLHRLLRKTGTQNLRTDEILDKSGRLAVVFRTPNWEDFVHLTFTEIRHCGSQNMQIVRRLRAMIENLIQTLPKHRHAILLRELELLDRDVEKHFVHPEDRFLARLGDSQGLGGASGAEKMQS
jgi:uncharacterized membrane protein